MYYPVTGGNDYSTDQTDYVPQNTVDLYIPASDTWVALSNLTYPVTFHQMINYRCRQINLHMPQASYI